MKEVKQQIWRSRFKDIKMQNDKTVDVFFTRVHEIICFIKVCGEEIHNATMVRKILRTLLETYNTKVSSIENKDLDRLPLDDLHCILVAYEMRIAQMKKEKKSKVEKELTFKAMGKLKIKDQAGRV